MYDASGKSNDEVFSDLVMMLNKSNEDNKDKVITLQELVEIVATRSVKDEVANENALTIFYSGESEELINTMVKEADDTVRVIRRTEAYKFLNNPLFTKILSQVVQNETELNDEALQKEVERLMIEASYYDAKGTKVEGGRILDTNIKKICDGNDRRCLFLVCKCKRRPNFCNG